MTNREFYVLSELNAQTAVEAKGYKAVSVAGSNALIADILCKL